MPATAVYSYVRVIIYSLKKKKKKHTWEKTGRALANSRRRSFDKFSDAVGSTA